MRRIVARTRGAAILFVVSTMLMAVGVGAAAAATERFTIPINTVVIEKRRAPGFVKQLLTQATQANLIGATCNATATAGNQESVHPNNDLLIGSGASAVTLPDVERAPGAVTHASGLTLGKAIVLSVRLGGDLRFSANMTLDFECEVDDPPPPPPPPDPCVVDPPNPDVTITVTPQHQFVEDGQNVEFAVSVTNSGDEALTGVTVDSSVDACDNNIGVRAVGENTPYMCSTALSAHSAEVTFAVAGVGAGCDAEVAGEAQALVSENRTEPPQPAPPPAFPGISPRPITPTIPILPTAIVAPPPSLTSTIRTTTATTTPATPTGVPTGIGDGATPRMPIGALAVVGLGITAIAAGTYRISRKEE